MKLIKLFGLAAVAAIATTALVGATSASAMTTSLCKVNELPCSEANTYPMTTSISAEAKELKLTSNIGTWICEKSSMGGKITELSELPNGLIDLLGEITSLTFTGCTINGSKCTVTAEGLPDMFALSQIEETMSGTLVTSNTKIHMSGCLNCTFGGEISLEVIGGEMANIVAEDILQEEGIFCPGEIKWTAKYLVSEPSGAMYVSN